MTGSATRRHSNRCAARLAVLIALWGCSTGDDSSTANSASGAPRFQPNTAGMGAGSDPVSSPGAISGGDTATPASAEDAPGNGSNANDASATPGDAAPNTALPVSDMGDDGTERGDESVNDPDSVDSTARVLRPAHGWDCGMPDGLPVPELGQRAFEIRAQLGDTHDVGKTQYGVRKLLEIRGGTMEGPDVRGTILEGGLDWQLTLDNGVVEVEQAMLIETEAREWLYMRNCGVASDSDTRARVVVDVEARSSGPHAWLHGGPFVGVRELDLQAGALTLRVFDVAAVADGAGENAVQIDKPAGVPSQLWECEPASGRRGAVVFNETVGIGSGISVGASKRGTRSAIPITGGSIDGRIKGSVLPGGADFQIIDGGYVLDARYTLKTDDGVLILVRNCGPASNLVPRFETRVDGPYAWLNEDRWLSSSPGLAAGAVNITIHERD